ncbi:unnamed protein product [Brassica rapa subsp. narinosa]
MDISALASMKNVAKYDTWCELQNPVNHESLNVSCTPSLLDEGTSAWVSQIVVPPSSRGYGTEADLLCVTARVRRSGPKALDDPKSSTRPQQRTGPKFPGKGRQRE